LHKAKELDLEPTVLRSILTSNTHQVEEAYKLIRKTGKKKVAMLGLSFKPGTDDLRESPIAELTEILIGKGYQVSIYDREVSLARLHGSNKAYIEQTIPHISRLMKTSLESAIDVSVYRFRRLALLKKLHDRKRSGINALLNKLRVVVGYLSESLYFTIGCLVLSIYVSLREGFDVVHAHNPPDTLFIVGAFHKMFGKKFVFDHHDLSPELYRSRYKTAGGAVARVLGVLEK